MTKEVQTAPILEWLFAGNKRVFVPKIVGKSSEDMRMPELVSLAELDGLAKTKWGIPEFTADQLTERPDGLDESALVDVVLAPGVAFTAGCERLGHGKGYYDCFLAKLQAKRKALGLPPAFIVGLALDQQIVESVPTTDHDVVLDAVTTPSRMLSQHERKA